MKIKLLVGILDPMHGLVAGAVLEAEPSGHGCGANWIVHSKATGASIWVRKGEAKVVKENCGVCGTPLNEENKQTNECSCGRRRCQSCDFGVGTVCAYCEDEGQD